MTILLLITPGCVTVPAPIGRPPRPSLPESLARHYDYRRQTLQARQESVEPGSGYTLERITLFPPDGTPQSPIRLDWYKPEGNGAASSSRSHRVSKPGRHPAVLLSPILAGNDLYVREFARFYAARGLHAVLVYRQKEVFSAGRPLSDIEKHLQESIIEIRRVIDWLETQPEVDSRRIGSFAISMGAILTSILATVEPRVRCSVLGLPAGRIPEILMSSQDKGIRKRRENYLRENNRKPEEALEELRSVIVSEPLRFAPAADPRRVLLIAGLFDRVLGLGRSLELWRAMGRPSLILLPTGHYSAYFATPYLKIVTYSFLRRHLS